MTTMKMRVDNYAARMTRKSLAIKNGSGIIKFVGERNLAVRFLSVLMMTALLIPLVFFGQSPRASAQTASVINQLPIPVSAPAEPFISSSISNSLSGSLIDTTLSAAVSLNARLTNGYGVPAGFFTTPTLPEGFAMAKLPTFWERVSSAFAPSISSLTSFVAPLVFVSPNNSIPTVNAKTNNATAAEVEMNNATAATESNVEPTSPAAPLLYAPGTTKFDFDGDGKADVSRWQSASGEWKVKNSSNGSFSADVSLGAGTAAAPADYDGDGKTDRAVFTDYAGMWKIKKSLTNQIETISSFGQSGDKVVSGDYDGDGTADLAVWRPSSGTWYVRQSGNQQVISTQFGASTDIPVPGNYDGDNKMDYAVYRPSTGTWYALSSSTGGLLSLAWGAGTDTPVPADYDGDGKTDFAVYRPSNGTWYINQSNGNPYLSKVWGNYGDQPVPADYDNDGKADFAVWRATTGVWYIARSSDPNFNTYEYHQLGITGDIAVPSAYLKQIGGQVLAYNLANARLAPKNATGGSDLYSRNFSWGTGLVGLPGRAGLDAGFGISYNSLVWTKETTSNTMVFDADHANISPGFNFGFPTIEPGYYNGLTQKFSYLMVTPSGGRVEFRQNAASNIYETADSSYTQLRVNTPSGGGPQSATEDLTVTVTMSDGTMLDYGWKAGAYRLNQIKDRNGNFISVVYDNDYGLLRSVTDTLGRVVNVNYDSEFYPTSITQNWKSGNGDGSVVTHTYATFTYDYAAINPNFAAGLGVFGPSGGTLLKVLNRITYPSGGSTTFEYNAYGQVWRVRQVAADSSAHELSSVRTDLQTPTAGQADCPRFSTTWNTVENFNGGNPTIIHNTFEENQTFNIGGQSGTATKVEVSMDNAPHNITSRTWYYPAGNWAEGLPFATEDIADGTRQRWTRQSWTQDNTSLIYQLNPRVTQSKVGDASNVKRTDVNYWTTGSLAGFGLVKEVMIYDDNTNALQKKSVTSYKDDTAYLSRRIIGLPLQSELYDGTNNLMAKVTYNYDEGDFNNSSLQQNIAPVQHDNTNYSSSFIIGRGNPTSTTRYDVLGQSAAVTSSVKYNTAGAVVSSTDPLNRSVSISYADSFNDGVNSRNTFAYPTTLTDPAGNFSQVKYRYDIGANVWAKSPAPAGNTNGKETTRIFDTIGRLERQTLVNNGAYTRYEYPANQIQSKVYSTIVDINNNGADAADEVLAESWTDGAGRVRYSRTEHPGSAGGWSGSKAEYDILGQVTRSTVPTEINPVNAADPLTWTPTGDDAAAGWRWKYNKYDWKGRVTREINTDGVDSPTLNDSDILISYDGCGCAGGQVTTIQGELVPRNDQPTVNARRTQKVYADILGRTYKTEVMNWDGTTPYTTSVNTFNGRDQITNIRQYAGAVGSNTYQDVVMSYDGHGRMKTRHYPIEDAGANTTWSYNADDSIQMIIDPRGAITNFTYNDTRGLLTNISYSSPNPTAVPVTPSVSFGYDAIGNRISMTDGTGTNTYSYNNLSQLLSETKQFNDSLPNAPLPNNSFKIDYSYNLSGGVQAISDPFGSVVNYANDKTGRVTAVSGSPWAQNTTGSYASNIKYRAWGAVKQLDYTPPGDTEQVKMDYDNRLRVSHYEYSSGLAASGYLMKADFSYLADSRTQAKNDLLDDKWDRTMQYDHAGRLTFNQFNREFGGTGKRVYEQTIQYDAFSQMTSRQITNWDSDGGGFTATYLNGRKQDGTLTFDAAGNITAENHAINEFQTTAFDAAGRRTAFLERWHTNNGPHSTFIVWENKTEEVFDGDGRPVIEKRGQRQMNQQVVPTMTTAPNMYQIWSSVLGSSLTQVLPSGDKYETKVFAGGAVIAKQVSGAVEWTTSDPITGTVAKVGSGGAVGLTEEYEPLGQKIRTTDPTEAPEPTYQMHIGGAEDAEWQCQVPQDFYGGFQ
ncbi:MAG: FG-GAP-like repeat-containing protein, partial [Pyrinomonadaceae bacterium]